MDSLILVQNEIAKSSKIFETLKEELSNHLPGLKFNLEHIGSTVIPEALTKPVLDVLLIVDNKTIQLQVAEILTSLGFVQGELSPD